MDRNEQSKAQDQEQTVAQTSATDQGGKATTSEGKPSEAMSAAEIEALQHQVDELRAQANEWLDQYRRTAAEFANYRKRQDRDREQQTLRIKAEVVKPLLVALDDFNRALKNAPAEVTGTSWWEGLALVERKLKAILDDFQVVAIQALGEPFNPYFHSALLQEPSNEFPKGTVMEELEKGYLLKDQVIRPTLVKVSSGPGPENKSDEK